MVCTQQERDERTDILAGNKLGVLLARKYTEGVGTEVVTLKNAYISSDAEDEYSYHTYLRLEQVRRDNFAAVAVEESKCR